MQVRYPCTPTMREGTGAGSLSSEYGTHKTDSGLGFQIKVLKTVEGVAASWLGSGGGQPISGRKTFYLT